jgi:hypothetical protein
VYAENARPNLALERWASPSILELRLAQSGDTVSGSWIKKWVENDQEIDYLGRLSGSMGSSSMEVTLEPDNRDCLLKLTATISGNRMKGTYGSVEHCPWGGEGGAALSW